jgi:hypothetical protein
MNRPEKWTLCQEAWLIVYLRPDAIQNHLNLQASLMSLHQRFGDGSRREPVSLDEDSGLCGFEFLDDRIAAAALWREIDLDGRDWSGQFSGYRLPTGGVGGEQDDT